ncbi:unnamed protein product (macronuclear) [Paramecium tetraurelia]|uniref:Protein kinase domain-containing protein n=1 Tax=Paramecium tetraurelia TaxID=5888 RepID=A0CDW7_PARTE|nr:uncharacterized protein GSPATT00007196001 [Paramecium tetraurelia]CAK68984.1 unnamed protein product [Paramecium tetraurelia]|eukprot:XP_001436381.1 hypothetical protein (macronuclear) [Paramecium tetraurelia strain d4-2]
MSNIFYFTTSLLKKQNNEKEQRFAYLLENYLIINKREGLNLIDRKFDLTSMDCQIKWHYENNIITEMMVYDTKQNQRIVYYQKPEALQDLQNKLNGKAFYRNFKQFYQKLEVIKSHKNVEIMICKNILTEEIVVAKQVKFLKNKHVDSDHNSFVMSEAKIYMKLSYNPHQYLLGAHQIFICDQSVIYIMPHCKGGTLYEYLVQNDLNLPELVTQEMMRKLLIGLNHLHNIGIMHRDIKLDNIMLLRKNDPNSIRIMDFGYSTLINDEMFSYQRCGTPGYIAPEILNMGQYNQLCDIYSLGCVFHALLTGKKLYNTPKSTKASELLQLNRNSITSLSQICNLNALELLQSMIAIVKYRPSASTCLQHSYFEEEQFQIEDLCTQLKQLDFPQLRNPFRS